MGIASFSEDQWINWFAKGRTDFTGNSLTVVHGTNSTFTLGFTSEVFVGTQTSFTAGLKIGATKGGELSLSDAATLGSSNREEAYYMTSYAAAVGASANQVRNMSRLRIGIFILLGVQVVAMTSASIAALVLKSKKPDEDADLGLPELGIALASLNHISSLLAVLATLLFTFRKKWFGIAQPADPTGVLTIDRIGGVFLGARLTDTSAGITINDSGIQLNAAADLSYEKPQGSPSILGFTDPAEASGGARLHIRKDGQTELHGKQFDVALGAGDDTGVIFKARSHSFFVTNPNSLSVAGPAVEAHPERAMLRHSFQDYVRASQNKVVAAAGGNSGSILTLEPSSASLSVSGTTLKITTGVIKAGNFTIDQTGLKFGNDFVVLSPPAPPQLVADPQIAAEQAEVQQTVQQGQIQQQQQAVEDAAQVHAASAMITAQSAAQNIAASGDQE